MKTKSIATYLLTFLIVSSASAREISIAIVDLQYVLNHYNRTQTEVERINTFYQQKQSEIGERKSVAQEVAVKAKSAGTKAADSTFDEKVRSEQSDQYQNYLKELTAHSKEISAIEQKSAQELATARQEMEDALLQDIKTVMTQIAESQGIDLIFDKSFLPKHSKVILFQSAKVTDLSKQIVEILNRQ